MAGKGEDNWKLGSLEEGSGAASYLPSTFPFGLYIPFKMMLTVSSKQVSMLGREYSWLQGRVGGQAEVRGNMFASMWRCTGDHSTSAWRRLKHWVLLYLDYCIWKSLKFRAEIWEILKWPKSHLLQEKSQPLASPRCKKDIWPCKQCNSADNQQDNVEKVRLACPVEPPGYQLPVLRVLTHQ